MNLSTNSKAANAYLISNDNGLGTTETPVPTEMNYGNQVTVSELRYEEVREYESLKSLEDCFWSMCYYKVPQPQKNLSLGA